MSGRPVSPRQSQNIITRTVVWVAILGYSLFLVAGSTYENYSMNKEIDEATVKIAEYEKKKRSLQLSLIYYKSNAFKEVEARRRLGLKGVGENVVALPEATSEPVLSVVIAKPMTPAVQERLIPYKAWWNLFFGSSG